MTKGEIIWQVAHGETPEQCGTTRAQGADHSPHGSGRGGRRGWSPGRWSIAGEPVPTTAPDRPRGAMLRAYDKATGKEVGAVYMPAQQSGSPMTYMHKGRQYIVVAVGGGNYSGEYIAFALPRN